MKNLTLKPGKNIVQFDSEGQKVAAHLFLTPWYQRPSLVPKLRMPFYKYCRFFWIFGYIYQVNKRQGYAFWPSS